MMKTLFMCALVICIMAGWVFNVYKLTKLDFEPSYKAEVIRTIGVFIAPVGVIGGYIEFSEEK